MSLPVWWRPSWWSSSSRRWVRAATAAPPQGSGLISRPLLHQKYTQFFFLHTLIKGPVLYKTHFTNVFITILFLQPVRELLSNEEKSILCFCCLLHFSQSVLNQSPSVMSQRVTIPHLHSRPLTVWDSRWKSWRRAPYMGPLNAFVCILCIFLTQENICLLEYLV